LTDTPKIDEFELSVFGGGYGECICVHLGLGEWAVVDSCINPHSRRPAALDYLESLGVDPSVAVRLVIATHWDDDHIRGLAETIRVCVSAKVAISAALRSKEVLAFVERQASIGLASGSGVDELRQLLEECRVSRPPVLAKCNVTLFFRTPPPTSEVKALSPSDDACLRSIELLMERSTGKKIAVPRRYRAPESANGASVVAAVDALDCRALLGGDLMRSSNSKSGWEAVVTDSYIASRSSVVKVPHHGAESGHDPRMWTELLVDDSLAIVAPWERGGRSIPTPADVTRLKGLAGEVYLTAIPKQGKLRRSADVARMIKKMHPQGLSVSRGWGQVRARKSVGEGAWRVELRGDAVRIP
jgi:hypothetical protein